MYVLEQCKGYRTRKILLNNMLPKDPSIAPPNGTLNGTLGGDIEVKRVPRPPLRTPETPLKTSEMSKDGLGYQHDVTTSRQTEGCNNPLHAVMLLTSP